MAARTKQVWLTVPGIGVAMLPKLLCPLCWPLYAAVVSSVGMGFLVGTTYLIPITSAFLVLTLAVLGFRATKRRGFGPFLIGIVASAAVLIGKFYLESNALVYGGVGLLVIATSGNRNRMGCLASSNEFCRVSELRSKNDSSDQWNGDCASWKTKGELKCSVRDVVAVRRRSNW